MRALRGLFAALVLALAAPAGAVTVQIINADGPGEGFNDPTPVSPEGGNPGTTRGQQRLNLFQAAANIWAAQLGGTVTVQVSAQFNAFPVDQCGPGGGVLGFAGPRTFFRNFSGAPVSNTWYPIALVNQLAGSDQLAGQPDIDAEFNSNIDTGCLGAGTRFWYGTTSAAPSGNFVNLLPTLLHEIGHGLGFISLVCDDPAGCGAGNPQGSLAGGFNDIWNDFLAGAGNPALKFRAMTNAQRAALIQGDPNLIWNGANVNAALPGFITGGTAAGFLRMHGPATYAPGSTLSHFSTAASPNLLMEPFITSTVFNSVDLTLPLFRDIGWPTAAGASNQPPVIAAPPTITLAEDVPSGLAGITISDPDSGAGALTATFSVAQGTLAATSGGGVTVGGTATARTLQGTLSALNTFLNGNSLTYTTALNSTTSQVLNVLVSDNGNSGPGGAQSDSENVTLQVTAVNDAPTVSAPAAIAVTEDVATSLTGIAFADVDADVASVHVTFAVPSGSVGATPSGGVSVGGSGASRVLVGAISSINAFVAAGTVRFTTALNATAPVQLTITIDDEGANGAGGPLSANRNVTLNVGAVNDPPVIGAPVSIAVPVGAPGPLAGITLSDVDAGATPATLVFAVSGGTLAASAGGGVGVAGSGTNTLTLSGTVAAISAFLGATPPSYTGGNTTLTLTANDGGGSGSGGAQGASAPVQVVAAILFRDGFE